MNEQVNRHKIFISYHHNNDQIYKDKLIEMNERYNIFDDYSVGDRDIIDENKKTESIRVEIRDNFIKGASVLVLLCGKKTKYRKYVDWELHAAMYDTEKNPKMGILVINLPQIKESSSVRAPDLEEKNLIGPNSNWISINNLKEMETHHPYMPARLIENFVKKDVDIAVVNWETIEKYPLTLRILIDKAFKRRKSNKYDTSKHLKSRNS